MSWTCLCVVPNVHAQDLVHMGPIALAGVHESRVREEADTHSNVRRFLERFTDAHGKPVPTSVIVWEEDAGFPKLKFDALCSFRDLVAAAHVLLARSTAQVATFTRGTQWMDSFDIYPWMIGSDRQHLVCFTPAMRALHTVEEFCGQASPGVPHCSINKGDLDSALFQALIGCWRQYYLLGQDSHFNLSLFRSLNMAYRAGSMPGVADSTPYDLGRLLALWVSAFEILVHPGAGGDVSINQVLTCLDAAPYVGEKVKERCHERTTRSGSKQTCSLPAALYSKIYTARNRFLHGNPIDDEVTSFGPKSRHLLNYAPALYRLALASKLNLRWTHPKPPANDIDATREWISGQLDFETPQRLVERCLLSALS